MSSNDSPSRTGWLRWSDLRVRVLAGVLTLLAVALPVGFVLGDRGLPEDAALRVDGTVVSTAQLQRRVDVLQALYGVREPRAGRRQDQFRRDVAKAIAVSMILEGEARERGVVVATKAARSTLSRLIEREFPDTGRSGFVRALGNVGVGEREVLDEIERQLVVSQLFDRITAEVRVSDEDVVAEFDARREELAIPERRRIRNIVVAERATAVQVLRRARAGSGFAELVRKYSLDASTRNAGGDMGLLAQADLEADYGRAAFRAPVGGIFGPVKTRFGWNVGQVVSSRPARPLGLDRVRAELRRQLETEKALEVWRDWVAEQIRGADVEYAPRFRPTDPDSPPSGQLPDGLTDGEGLAP